MNLWTRLTGLFESDRSRISREAWQWRRLLWTDESIETQFPKFEAWLEQDPLHAEAYAKVERICVDFEIRLENILENVIGPKDAAGSEERLELLLKQF